MSGPKGHEHISVTEQNFHEGWVWSLRTLSANTGILYASCYRIVTQIMKMRTLSKKVIPL